MNNYERSTRNFNKDVQEVKARNFYIPPVNQPRWSNPFLLDSKNDILNQLLSQKDELLKLSGRYLKNNTGLKPTPVQKRALNPLQPTGVFNNLTEPELAGLVQDMAYEKLGERQDIQGYTKIQDIGTDNIVGYRSIDGKRILLGVAGTRATSIKDWLTDASLGVGSSIALKSDRFTNLQRAYETVRARNPNAQIVVGGHSLGGAIILELLKNNLNDNKLKGYAFNGWINPEYSGAGDPRFQSIRTSGDLIADVKEQYHGGVGWAETHIKDPEELSRYKKAVGLIATGHLIKEGYGAYKKFLKNQNRAKEADAMEWALQQEEGVPDVEEFARRSGITPTINSEGVSEFILGKGTNHEVALTMNDIQMIADSEQVTGENWWEEGEDLAIDVAENRAVGGLLTGTALGVGGDLLMEKFLAHKSKNFVTNNAKTKLIGEDKRSGKVDRAVKAGVTGAIIGGVVGAGKSELKDRAISKFEDLTAGMSDRAINKLKDISRGFRNLRSSMTYTPPEINNVQLPVPEPPAPIGSTARLAQGNAETILDPVGTAGRNIDGLKQGIRNLEYEAEKLGELLEYDPELLFTSL